MQVDRLALLIISFASWGLGLAVYQRAPDRVWNKLYAVQTIGVSFWVFCNYLIQAAPSAANAGIWVRLAHLPVALVICMCVDFAWVFPERIKYAQWQRRLVLYAIGLLFSMVALAPGLYTSIALARGTVLVRYGWPFGAFGIFTVATLGYADYILFRKRRQLSGLQRVQVNYVLNGWLLTQSFAVIAMVFLPLIWKNTDFSRWGSASYLFNIIVMAYAIAKHRIVKPEVAVYRVAAYVITGAGVAGLVMSGLLLAEPLLPSHRIPIILSYLITGIVMGIVVVPVHRYVWQALERTFLTQSQLEDSFRHISDAILRTLDADELHRLLSETILHTLHPTQVSVFMKDGPPGQFTRRSQCIADEGSTTTNLPQTLASDHILAQVASDTRDMLYRAQVFRFRSLSEAQAISAAMQTLDTEVLAPMLWEDELVGLVCIGEKLSGEMYETEELEMLRNMMPPASLALRNAQLYAQVAQMKEFNENILQEMESGVIAVNAGAEIVLYNRAAENILGLSREEVIGRDVAVLPEDIANYLHDALTSARVRSGYQFVIERPNGQTVPVSCSTSRWSGPIVSQEGAVTVISDLTLVQELEWKRQEAERLAVIRLLSAGMAHEIRNPMVAIRTFAELLPRRWDDPEFRSDFLAMAQEEIERIDQLLSQLLMLSKPADAEAEKIEVNEVCERVVRAMSARAESQQVQLITELAAMRYQPIGDESRLHQALVNLVTNAVDAEPRGGQVKVITEEDVDDEENPVVRIRVYNSGSYIAPGQSEQIFRPFYSQKAGGTGLGLAICQTIIEEHSGSIQVHSRPEEGTEFIVQLPADRPGVENGEG